jgi:hypothetical protein
MVWMVNDDRHSSRNKGSDVSRLAVLSFPHKAGIQISAVQWLDARLRGHDRSDRKSGLQDTAKRNGV